MHTPVSILEKYWGFPAFRPLQEEIINSVLQSNDTLALLPTGGGKSICFQVPALYKDGLCLVISPLIALMKDQVANLQRKGIAAVAIHAGMNNEEVQKTFREAAAGDCRFLYLSPERLLTNLFYEYLPALKPVLIAIDEAHCISQWGYDFRPAYLQISKLRLQLPDVPVLALTASATLDVQNDICEKLNFRKNQQRFQQSFERPNLSYSVFRPVAKQTKLLEILQNVPGSGIVYCKSRKQTQQIAELLKMHGINADFYHAGLDNDTRNQRQENWISNSIQTIVCTNAFGMGIDKPDVRVVVHYEVPDCLENYYQEAGRAGRDGKKAYAVLLYAANEMENLRNMINQRFPEPAFLKEIYISLMNHYQIAAGTGEGRSLPLDIQIFASINNLSVHQASYAIQALAKDHIFSYNEMVFTPSSIEFTVTKDGLNEFMTMHPELDFLIKGLLRTYEGIFDYPTPIYESQLAYILKKPLPVVKKELLMLHGYAIINYKPQSERPEIFLMQNRMYVDDFKFNVTAYLQRKEHFKNRINAVENFINETSACRSSMIAAYFNDEQVKKCGICDNCITYKKKLTEKSMETLSDAILQSIAEAPKDIKILEKQFHSDKLFWQVIKFLQSENKIKTNKNDQVEKIN